MVDRDPAADESAAGTSHEDGCLEVDGIHEGQHVRREVLRPVAVCGTGRVAMASLRRDERVDRVGQFRQDALKAVPRVCNRVKEQ